MLYNNIVDLKKQFRLFVERNALEVLSCFSRCADLENVMRLFIV